MVNIILCGGSGTRLWPLSRQKYPKQFCNLLGGKSLFQRTVKRNKEVSDKIYVVTNSDHYFIAANQIEETFESCKNDDYVFLLEPVGRNTAPAIALACFDLDPEEIVLVSASDHLIQDEKSYFDKIQIAKSLSEKNFLATFGIKPDYPETGYGYIEANNKEGSTSQTDFSVKSFKEKPDKVTAEKYLKDGNFLWNSGMFAFKAGTFLNELKQYSPQIYEKSLLAYNNAKNKIDNSEKYKTLRINVNDMKDIPSDSIDYAVMEKSQNVKVIPSDIGWNDLGSFDSLYDVSEKDSDGNTVAENVINLGSKNNLIISGKRKVTTIDMEDSIIVDTPDAILVGKKGSSQLVKQVVDQLQTGDVADKELTELHNTVFRPWGTYTILEESNNYKIKNIVVKPGKRISLQKHMHRSEHWVVVSGTAKVDVDDKEMIVRKNESTYIPIGATHRLANEGKIDLVIIESQVGEYVGEDDIIRFDDDFKRS